MRIGQAKGAQVGSGNTQHNTYLPPEKGARHRVQDSSTVTITAGDNATVSSTQRNTHLKFSIPVLGPLFSFVSVHPVIAVTTAVVVLGGTGAAVNSAISDSKPGVSTALVRGFQLTVSNADTPPVGYDFSHTPPVVAGPNTDAIYVQNGFVYSTSGKLAHWTGAANPTAAGCRTAIAQQPEREVVVSEGSLTCYLDQNGDPGFFTVTSDPMLGHFITIDTAHLG